MSGASATFQLTIVTGVSADVVEKSSYDARRTMSKFQEEGRRGGGGKTPTTTAYSGVSSGHIFRSVNYLTIRKWKANNGKNLDPSALAQKIFSEDRRETELRDHKKPFDRCTRL